jgi:hypothetical protein
MITFRVSTEVKDDRRVEIILPEGVPTGQADLVVNVLPRPAGQAKRPRTSLADWAEQNAEHWAKQLDSTDVATFTGRRF